MAQNACINKLHVTSRPIILWGCHGAVKIRKTHFFLLFGCFSPMTLVFLIQFTSKRSQNAGINKLHVILRPIFIYIYIYIYIVGKFFLFLGLGGRKNQKKTIFDVFGGFLPITLVFLNRFTSKIAQNACINKLHVTLRSITFWGCQGAVKMRKIPYF